MYGLSILILALNKIWRNKDEFLKINGFWFVVATLASMPLNFMYPDGGATGGLYFVLLLVSLFALIIGTVIVAIAWHRFVLRGEVQTNWFILGNGWPLSRYFWTSFGPVLAALVAVAPLFALHVGHEPSERLHNTLANLAIIAIFWCVVLLLSVVLPAIAVEESFSFRNSLTTTLPRFASIALIALILSALTILPDEFLIKIFGDFYAGVFGIMIMIGYLISSAIYWLTTLLFVGVLSEIYRVSRLQTPSSPNVRPQP